MAGKLMAAVASEAGTYFVEAGWSCVEGFEAAGRAE